MSDGDKVLKRRKAFRESNDVIKRMLEQVKHPALPSYNNQP